MEIEFPVSFDQLLDMSRQYGLKLMDTVLDPILIIAIDESSGNLTVQLAASRYIKGKEKLLWAPTIYHNYVVSDTLAYPLPRDIGNEISALFQGKKVENLPIADVIRLKSNFPENIKIRFGEEVFDPAAQNASISNNNYKVSKLLKASLYPYQSAGVAWISKMLKHSSGLILADEMGLGKTVQVIASILDLEPTHENPVLIVCPTSLIANWVSEIHKFAPSLSILVHRGATRGGVAKALKTVHVVLSTYDTLVVDEMLMRAINWRCVVCDEAQALKNPDSNRRNVISRLNRQSCLLMTGTPVETSLLDIWSLLDISIPGVLGTRDDFSEKFLDDEISADALNDLVAPLILRRTVAQVAQDLPERIDIECPISLGEDLEAKYETIRQQALDEYGIAGGLVATTRLSIFCSHPSLSSTELENQKNIDDVRILTSPEKCIVTPKMELTLSIINEACTQNKKVLIFTNYNRMGDILRSATRHMPISYWNSINGSTPQEDRQVIIDEFTLQKGSGVLVLNPKAAGAGLNITAATVVIHYTPVWNPALEMQASARAHRRGQTLPVTVYSLFYEGTVEQVMMERARYRKELGNRVIPTISDDSVDILKALTISPAGI
ncbi:DEAD/DEAH box helicase [Acinetobacter lwoffii]|uniref:DEAD/DEAH box helicase n=1 Tax=Acinetobacter lwoffii TaxID=28090 RepID=UPI00209B9C5A|nr:DEAD/DEAH box helicase [Acinetobacter lwoffii]MCO8095369.1 DEAD/DEAH box helicase [Acinetobacter lwoffii]